MPGILTSLSCSSTLLPSQARLCITVSMLCLVCSECLTTGAVSRAFCSARNDTSECFLMLLMASAATEIALSTNWLHLILFMYLLECWSNGEWQVCLWWLKLDGRDGQKLPFLHSSFLILYSDKYQTGIVIDTHNTCYSRWKWSGSYVIPQSWSLGRKSVHTTCKLKW